MIKEEIMLATELVLKRRPAGFELPAIWRFGVGVQPRSRKQVRRYRQVPSRSSLRPWGRARPCPRVYRSVGSNSVLSCAVGRSIVLRLCGPYPRTEQRACQKYERGPGALVCSNQMARWAPTPREQPNCQISGTSILLRLRRPPANNLVTSVTKEAPF